MRFFLDANIPYSALEIFKELNLEALHARSVGLGKLLTKRSLNMLQGIIVFLSQKT